MVGKTYAGPVPLEGHLRMSKLLCTEYYAIKTFSYIPSLCRYCCV